MGYTSELHTQLLIALLKKHGIKKIVASPGATNVCFVASVQQDPYFTLYSSVDERSAAFIACGIAAESGEPVALTCTGSTASRNYIPGLTEAYYRHLPVLAITSTKHLGKVGNLYSQVIDRSVQLNDMVNVSVTVDEIHTKDDRWQCELDINRAILALKANGGGPAHINLVTTYSRDYSTNELPSVKAIEYYNDWDIMPTLDKYKRIAILVGVHRQWSDRLTSAVETFCQKHDAVVLRYHASNYQGEYGMNQALFLNMAHFDNSVFDADLVIFIGSVPRYSSRMGHSEMWRVSPDGKIVDPETRLSKVFNMDEAAFFEHYNQSDIDKSATADSENGYARTMQKIYQDAISAVGELPFSNVWIAQNTISKLPQGSVLHMAGSNTARAWNYFQMPKNVVCHSNDGTMGIDGQLSSLIGESLATPEKLHLGVMGDLTVFYDLNSLGNRHIKSNMRLILINNGVGAEFKIYSHAAYDFGDQGTEYIAAGGHFGKQSRDLIRHYAEDLGYEYLSANNKDEYLEGLKRFLTDEPTDKPMIFEVFTNAADESDGIYAMNHLIKDTQNVAVKTAKNAIKKVAGEKGIETIKKLIKH